MRLLLTIVAALLVSGCVGPHSTGSLWVLRNVELDQQLFRTTDAVRAQQAQSFEVGLADEALAAERQRLEAALQGCPSRERQPLVVSSGDRVRDEVRVRIGADGARLSLVAQLALADWRLRRANATGAALQCDAARGALDGKVSSTERSAAIDALGPATVSRAADQPPFQGETNVALSLYALGVVEAVTAPGPLPRYLARVYGGTVSQSSQAKDSDAAATVDRIAATYPEWEPDGLLAALE